MVAIIKTQNWRLYTEESYHCPLTRRKIDTHFVRNKRSFQKASHTIPENRSNDFIGRFERESWIEKNGRLKLHTCPENT